MIFPCLIGPFNIILIKNYIEDLPLAIEESAKIDGANDMVILFKIILPMSTPIIATVALFVAVGNWNSYWMAMLHINKPNLYPLQLLLRNMLLNTTNSMTGVKAAIIAQEKSVYDLSLQMGDRYRCDGTDFSCLSVCAEVFHQGHHARRRKGLICKKLQFTQYQNPNGRMV